MDLLIQLAEGHARVQQQSLQTMEDLATPLWPFRRGDPGGSDIRGGNANGEGRISHSSWGLGFNGRTALCDALPGNIAKVVADELRPVTAALNALPDAIAKAVAEEFRPLLSLREDGEDRRRRVEALEKK